MLALLLPIATITAPVETTPFDRVAALAGQWRGTGEDGRAIDIRYKVISNGAAVVEEWTSPSGRQTMTVYYRDGDDVLATHFCAQGNQPRLVLDRRRADSRLSFTFRDATNLAAHASHLTSFWVETGADGTMRRAETYERNGTTETEVMMLRRVPA